MAYTAPWQLMGIWVSGDVGGITIYTDQRGRKTAFPKSPPEKPPSEKQIHQRARFRTAQVAWSNLTDTEKRNLEEACIRTSLVLTGQNLYISASLRNDDEGLVTVSRQANVPLPTVTYIP